MASAPPPYARNPPPGPVRQAYSGTTRELLVAIDIGTTYSGISYSILEPGAVPRVLPVTRFPGQEHQAGTFKIPTVIWYDATGRMKVAGAEADLSTNQELAEENQWVKAEWFKMHLRPRSLVTSGELSAIKPLPLGKTVEEVFTDYLRYIFDCLKKYIEVSHNNGALIWSSCKDGIQFVMSHPNGWEGAQQRKMRESAIKAGLIPATPAGRRQISFVTEGEASLHSCLSNGLAGRINVGDGILIADLGGGTLDCSSYKIKVLDPLIVEEIVAPGCSLQGSVFVRARAKRLLKAKLAGSRYGTDDSVEWIAQRFDETTKRLFRDASENQVVAFGSPVDKDLKYGIKNGQVRLTGHEVEQLFEPSVHAARTMIHQQVRDSHGSVKSVFLVGGFSASPWLLKCLQDALSSQGITVSRPEGHTSKAVTEGGILYALDHFVTSRVARFSYGSRHYSEYNHRLPDHQARAHRLKVHHITGIPILYGGFETILQKNTSVSETQEFKAAFGIEWTTTEDKVLSTDVTIYRGTRENPPDWTDEDPGGFSTLCTITADMSGQSPFLAKRLAGNGRQYMHGTFEVALLFGLTELEAQMVWKENGVEKRSPAEIIYDDD